MQQKRHPQRQRQRRPERGDTPELPSPDAGARPVTADATATSLWHAYTVVFAAACVMIGVYWDISWHMSIGRDTFWTPAHLLIQAGGLLAGISSGYVALTTTFRGTAAERGASVGLLGLPRAARRLDLHLGMRRDAHLRAVRQLVAQRLRPRRAHHQSAARRAGDRHLLDRRRRAAADARAAESRHRRTSGAGWPGCSPPPAGSSS